MKKDLSLVESPIISVVMPIYNAQQDLRAAIESILGQSFSDFELLIIDDGSTDESVQIIQSFEDSRIRLISQPKNLGLVAALNRGLVEVRGQFIARMDGDDICLPDRFALQLPIMQDQKLDICGSDWAQIDAEGRQFRVLKAPTSHEQVVATLANTVPYAHGSVMMRKSFIDEHDLQYRVGYGEDYDLWIRFFENGAKFGVVEKTLYLHREHSGSITTTKFKEQALASRVLRRKFVEKNLGQCNEALKVLNLNFSRLSKSVQVHCLYLAYRCFCHTGRPSALLKLVFMSSPDVLWRFLGRTIRA